MPSTRARGEAKSTGAEEPAQASPVQPIWLLVDSSGIGGIERHMATLARSLIGQGLPVEIVLLAHHPGNSWLEQLAAERLIVRTLGGTFSCLFNALGKFRPCLLHTHGYKAGILGRIAARASGIPIVSTFHSGEPVGWRVRLYRQVDEWSAFLGHSIAISSAIQCRLPFGSHLIPSFTATQTEAPTGDLPRRVGFVGRLSREKRPDLFCAVARQSGSGLEWHIYGDGPMRRDLEVRFAGSVYFHGMVTDMSSVWPALGLLFMPSQFEALPLAGLEALAAGIPIVGSRVGGMADVVIEGKTGWLFESGNIAEASQRINHWRALSPTDQAVMREACWSHCRAEFSADALLPRILRLYQDAGARLSRNAMPAP